ncbi:hypothetical protein AM501_27990 [Aneurinibacillus migulanus]|uniref:hypothetical protein n=1 Tax=Aneurinibacillus migulanus TaxID=47500 RepID=UPI0005BA2731|nr:hypothetical protein [Aneurinibacillus migulanus]KIV53352.1 hypothetical protein TS64_20570 [Aneurinibacillus migulanus]KPD05186.1 hypothetical protein AM501_27990 [Aneurinibacillus migulanus]CEH30889.1 Uncharacterized protein BN1090_A2_03348 [Aneurinibacillus migulanus]
MKAIKFEASIWYHAICAWRSSQKQCGLSFTHHKKSIYFGLFLMLLHVQIIEGAGLHFALHHVSPILAWCSTILHMYMIIWLLGDYNALRHSMFTLDDHSIHFQIGLRKSVHIPFDCIESITAVRTSSEDMKQETDSFHAEACPRIDPDMGLADTPQFELHLKNPVVSTGMFGRKKTIQKVYVHVDEPQAFIQAVKQKMEENIQ